MAKRVLLVDLHSRRVATLGAALRDSGFEVVGVMGDSDRLYEAVQNLAPDAVIVDAQSPSRDALEHLAVLSQRFPKPLLMLSAQDDRKMLAAAADAGLSAYVVEGFSPALVRSLIDVALRNYENTQALRTELADARETLASRKVVDRAKSLLMEQHGLSERDAYARLRRAAMDKGLPMAELARHVLDASAF